MKLISIKKLSRKFNIQVIKKNFINYLLDIFVFLYCLYNYCANYIRILYIKFLFDTQTFIISIIKLNK